MTVWERRPGQKHTQIDNHVRMQGDRSVYKAESQASEGLTYPCHNLTFQPGPRSLCSVSHRPCVMTPIVVLIHSTLASIKEDGYRESRVWGRHVVGGTERTHKHWSTPPAGS